MIKIFSSYQYPYSLLFSSASSLIEKMPDPKTTQTNSDVNEIVSLESHKLLRVKHIKRAQILANVVKKLIFLKRSWKNYAVHIFFSLFLLTIFHIYGEVFGTNVMQTKQKLLVSAKSFSKHAETRGYVYLAINSSVLDAKKIIHNFRRIAEEENANYTIVKNQTLMNCEFMVHFNSNFRACLF